MSGGGDKGGKFEVWQEYDVNILICTFKCLRPLVKNFVLCIYLFSYWKNTNFINSIENFN